MSFRNVLWKLAQAWLSSALTQAAVTGTVTGGVGRGWGGQGALCTSRYVRALGWLADSLRLFTHSNE